jgi:hypothetical protein
MVGGRPWPPILSSENLRRNLCLRERRSARIRIVLAIATRSIAACSASRWRALRILSASAAMPDARGRLILAGDRRPRLREAPGQRDLNERTFSDCTWSLRSAEMGRSSPSRLTTVPRISTAGTRPTPRRKQPQPASLLWRSTGASAVESSPPRRPGAKYPVSSIFGHMKKL